jgi:ADP-heptose:LPS heptosyltransferase
LLSLSRLRFISLQYDVREADRATLENCTAILPLPEDASGFAATAALVANLDLVVTVDTSIAHLAGALGKRVFVLLPSVPDWRWLLGRDDSPWYPTARLFRRCAGETWEPVIRRMREELEYDFEG